jgi:hypothetical protein
MRQKGLIINFYEVIKSLQSCHPGGSRGPEVAGIAGFRPSPE